MIDRILASAVVQGASDIMLIAGLPVTYKVSGVLNRQEGNPLQSLRTVSMLSTVLRENRLMDFTMI